VAAVILFGSHAYGHPTSESDIDLYVVTKDNYIPDSYGEKRAVVRKVSKALIDIRLKKNLDLLVHTLPMHKKFYTLNSPFAQDIKNKGIRIL
jgi:predicted nucleotidyltransferase